MSNLTFQLTQQKKQQYVVTMDAGRFERLAATFGFFGVEFLKSLNRSERDIKSGKVREISSLKELRSRKKV